MVTGENHAGSTADGNPACCLKSLCCLINEQRMILLSFKQTVCRTGECRGDDTCLAKQFGIDTDFNLRRPTLQALQFQVILVVATLSVGSQLPDGLSDGPEHLIVGMGLETAFISE